MGVGVPSGCEAIVHAVTSVNEDDSVNAEDKWTFLLDFSNAFNSISRQELFKEVRAKIPAMAPWLECCYGAQPFLHLEDRTILSCCGVQQGDPLGPLSFALTLHPKVKSEVPGLKINVMVPGRWHSLWLR